MSDGFDFERDFHRYLAAKQTVDDRAIDRRTFERLESELEQRDAISILEVGAGTGAMIERLLALDALPDRVEYTAVDTEARNLDTARERLPSRLEGIGYSVDRTDESLRIERDGRIVSLELVVDDAIQRIDRKRCSGRTWDLLVGHAVLDVIGLDSLGVLLSAVPGGLCYFPITFDGATRFAPRLPLDERIERRYHRHMDRKPDGSSRAGQRVLGRLWESDVELLAVGGSDWVVYGTDAGYPADEAYFLHYIVDTIGRALADDPGLDDEALHGWVETRHEHVNEGQLTYVAHQLDLLGRVSSSLSD